MFLQLIFLALVTVSIEVALSQALFGVPRFQQDPEVVGGIEADPNSIPWQVAVVRRSESIPRCGGTIICAKFVMTAAHCIGLNRDVNRFQVLAGEHDLSNDFDGATRHDVKNIFVHPDYIVKNRLVQNC